MEMSTFINFIQSLSVFSYIIVFLIAFFEVFVVIGAFLPGQNLIIVTGFIAHQGGFDIVTLMVTIFFGTVIGNFASYYAGKFYGDEFLLKFGKYFYLEEKHLKVAKAYMRKHCGKTLVIGRFNSAIRSFIPFIAGTTDVGFVKFSFYNIIGTILWTFVFVGLGYVLGASYEIAFGYTWTVSLAAFVIISVLFYLFYKKTYTEDILKA